MLTMGFELKLIKIQTKVTYNLFLPTYKGLA